VGTEGVIKSIDVITTFPQLSEPVAVPVAAGSVGSGHSTVTSAGSVNAGSIVSFTVIIWVTVIELPHSSVTL